MSFVGVLEKKLVFIKGQKITIRPQQNKVFRENNIRCSSRGNLTTHNLSQKYNKAWIELTNKCNINCIHCNVNAKSSNNTFLDFSYIRGDIINLLSLYKTKKLWLSGGEPTIHPDFCNIVEVLHKTVQDITVITNGLTLNIRPISELFNDLNIKCQISSEGITTKSIALIRGQSAAATIKTNICRARKILPNNYLTMNYVITNKRVDLSKVNDFAIKYGYNSLIFTFLKPIGRGTEQINLRISLEDRVRLFNEISKIRKSSPLEIKLSGGVFDHLDELDHEKYKTKYTCKLCTEEIQIMSDGIISPCVILEDFAKEIWAKDFIQAKINSKCKIGIRGLVKCPLL